MLLSIKLIFRTKKGLMLKMHQPYVIYRYSIKII